MMKGHTLFLHPIFTNRKHVSPHRRCPYLEVVVGLARSHEPESLATGRVSHARQAEGDGPDKEGHPGPPVWRLVIGRNSPTPGSSDPAEVSYRSSWPGK